MKANAVQLLCNIFQVIDQRLRDSLTSMSLGDTQMNNSCFHVGDSIQQIANAISIRIQSNQDLLARSIFIEGSVWEKAKR